MSYRSDRFNARMRSLEKMAGECDVSKWPLLSDNGAGVERMLDAMDDAKEEEDLQADRAERLFVAEMRLVEAGLRHLVPVLLLIVDNGSDRAASLARVPRATYFRHRDALLDFFCP